MESKKTGLFVISIIGFAVCLWSFVGAGDLDPVGPPASTMKTLDQVEPRIPIPGSSLWTGPFVINESGSYYLTGDRLCNADGILVNADNVTIDLMGYSLIGMDSGNNYGIKMDGRSNVEIRNGTVRDFGFHGIAELDNDNGKNHRVNNVRAHSNKADGIKLVGSGHLIKDCTAADNGEGYELGWVYGIYAGAGSTVVNNTAMNNGKDSSSRAYGIYTYLCTVIGNTAGNNGHGSKGTVYGICASGGALTGNSAYGNGNDSTGSDVYGIYVGPSCACVCNTAYRNGINSQSTVYGIRIGGESLVDQNSAYDNAGTNMNIIISSTYGTNHAP